MPSMPADQPAENPPPDDLSVSLRQNVGVRATVTVNTGAEIKVHPPRSYQSVVDGEPGRVPWVVAAQSSYGHGSVDLHVQTRELLIELCDAITAALEAAPDES